MAGGQRAGQAHGPGRVVGTVGNGHHTALKLPREQSVYLPMLDSVGGSVHTMTVAVRSDGDPLALIPAFRGVIQGMDADLPVPEVRSMDAVGGASVSRTSFTMALLLVGAGIALFLAAAALASLILGVSTAGVPPALALKGD